MRFSKAETAVPAPPRALAQKKLQQLNGKTDRGEYVPALDYVIDYTRVGGTEQAFAWLAKAVAERNRLALEIEINPIFGRMSIL